MRRKLHYQGVLTLALAAFVLRAFIPLGYMPAPLSSGLLFVLCPDQVPGIEGLSSNSSHHHHGGHHDHDAGEPHATDSCDFGHIVSSVAIVDTSIDIAADIPPVPASTAVPTTTTIARHLRPHHARAPPA